MSSKEKWRKSFQKARSQSQGSLDLNKNQTSLLEEEDLSVSDEELEKYLGTLRKKSGVERLWTGNTFAKIVDRTPDVSISSVSDGEDPKTEEDGYHSDDDFRPNILGLSEVMGNNEKSDSSEPSSIKPLEAINLISDIELSEEQVQLNNVKFSTISEKDLDNLHNVDMELITNDKSKIEEGHTLDEISEEIEEDLNNTNNSENTFNNNFTKGEKKFYHKEQSSHQAISEQSLSKTTTDKKKDETLYQYTYSTDFSQSESSKQKTANDTEYDTKDFSSNTTLNSTARSKKSSKLSSKCTKLQRKAKKKNHRDTVSCQDVGTQVNFEDISGSTQPPIQLPSVGMAILGPSHGNSYVNPTPLASHVVSADAVEAVTAYNPAIVALTDMLRQQLQLVEQFVDNSRRMHESYTQNLNTTYKYTTLEDTIEYLEKNGQRNCRRKSKNRHEEKT